MVNENYKVNIAMVVLKIPLFCTSDTHEKR